MAEQPSVSSITSLLQRCRKKKNLEYAKRMHLHIFNEGLEAHKAVGNFVVPMLVDCGSLSDAQQAFSMLSHRNEHSWTSLVLGYIECGQSLQAIRLYQKMQDDSICPSNYTLTALLRACGRLKDVENGRQIHVDVNKNGFEEDIFIGNTLVHMYAKCDSLVEALEVFDKLPVRDVVSWNALITGYAENGFALEALKCFKQMQVEGVQPDAVTFVSSLKACTLNRVIETGRELHYLISQKGFDRDSFVGNALLTMYAKCNSISEAYEVFEKLPIQDIVSWNALILAYTDSGLEKEAFNCYKQMQLENVSPDAITYVSLLKACANRGALKEGRELHSDIGLKGFERDVFVSSTLVDMYAKCGSLADAREVFDKLPVQDVVSWNTLIAGYAENASGQDALQCFEEMQLKGISPDGITFVCCLKACSKMGTIGKGQELHNMISSRGFDKDLLVGNALIDMYARCGLLANAQDVFDKLSMRDVVSWTSLIAGYADYGHCEKALTFFEMMRLEDILPDVQTFVCILRVCGSLGNLDKGRGIHIHIAQEGLDQDLFIGSSLIDMYTKCGSLSEARHVFDKLVVRDVVCWTAMIAGYAANGLHLEALACFEEMQLEDILPNAVTFVCSLKSCCNLGDIDKARDLHRQLSYQGLERDLLVGNSLIETYAKCGSLTEVLEVFTKMVVRDVVSWNGLIGRYIEDGHGMESLDCFELLQLDGLNPDAVSFSLTLNACGMIRAIDKGRELHAQIIQKVFETDLFVGSSLIDMYFKCGLLVEGQEVFDKLPVQDAVCWTVLIAGYADSGLNQEALKCFDRMQLEGVSPDAITYISSLKACGQLGAVERGREIHAQISEKGFEKDLFVGSSLIDMYAKCGGVSEALEVFDKLPVRNVVSWNAIISGYGVNHDGIMAVQCFRRMQEQGIDPDSITFISLLTSCSRASLLSVGLKYFNMMRAKYKIEPTADHYTCMVDLFARSGKLYEAEKLLISSPCCTSVGACTALLSACKTYAEEDIAHKCFQQLVQMNPENAASYALLANIYKNADRWDNADKTHQLRKHVGAKERHAKVDNEFVDGGRITRMLKTLCWRKEEGYVPSLNLAMNVR